ncbi:hypothetical protein EYF80_020212 [Liparis tanakae]|uniref:Uncharacterized protein n=1 Tax=Liparis tanakae TaxID=230148 RepID=A0A4Z2HV42_9TELE|nr:hypothetical protein EYF80_020212 [Liparis tanakae]
MRISLQSQSLGLWFGGRRGVVFVEITVRTIKGLRTTAGLGEGGAVIELCNLGNGISLCLQNAAQSAGEETLSRNSQRTLDKHLVLLCQLVGGVGQLCVRLDSLCCRNAPGAVPVPLCSNWWLEWLMWTLWELKHNPSSTSDWTMLDSGVSASGGREMSSGDAQSYSSLERESSDITSCCWSCASDRFSADASWSDRQLTDLTDPLLLLRNRRPDKLLKLLVENRDGFRAATLGGKLPDTSDRRAGVRTPEVILLRQSDIITHQSSSLTASSASLATPPSLTSDPSRAANPCRRLLSTCRMSSTNKATVHG